MKNIIKKIIEQHSEFKNVLEKKEICHCGGRRYKYFTIYEYCEDCGWGVIMIYKDKKIIGIVPMELPDRKSLLFNGKVM